MATLVPDPLDFPTVALRGTAARVEGQSGRVLQLERQQLARLAAFRGLFQSVAAAVPDPLVPETPRSTTSGKRAAGES